MVHRAVAEFAQEFSLDSIDEVILETAQVETDVHLFRKGQESQLRVRAVLVYSINGYHGSVKHAGPGPVEARYRRFDLRRQGKTLVISSRESTYMHHAWLLERLEVTGPEWLPIMLKRRELEQ